MTDTDRRSHGRRGNPGAALYGREHELRTALALVHDPDVRLVTLVGPGGVGKTRLALEVAAHAEVRLPGGAELVELDAAATTDELLDAVAAAFGVAGTSGSAVAATLGRVLGAEDVLLVLDGADGVEGVRGIVTALAEACAGLTALVTSVRPLHAPGERVVRLGPLSAGGADRSPDTLAGEPAVALFLARCQESDPATAPDLDQVGEVAAICRQLGGLPLAIELAAARVRLLGVGGLAGELTRASALDVVATADGAVPDRQRSLRAVLAWTTGLLAPDQRTLLSRLAVFEGGVRVDDAAALAPPARTDDRAALVADLDALLQAGLLEVRDGDPEVVALLAPVRELVRQQTVGRPEWATLVERHRDHVRATVAELAAHPGRAWLDRLAVIEPDVRRVLTDLAADPDPATAAAAVELAAEVAELVVRRGYDGLAGPALESLLERLARSRPGSREHAQALLWTTRLALDRSDAVARSGQIAADLQRGVALARELGDGALLLTGLSFVVLSLPVVRDPIASATAAREGLALAEAREDDWWRARFLAWAGMVAHQSGRPERAGALGRAALAVAKARGDDGGVVVAWLLMSMLPDRGGVPPEDRIGLEELLGLSLAVGNWQAASFVLAQLASVAAEGGDEARAADWSARRLELARRTGYWHGAGISILTLAKLAAERGDAREAALLHGSVLGLLPALRAATPPHLLLAYEQAMGAAADELGEAFVSAVEEGTARDPETALARALDYARGVSRSTRGGGSPVRLAAVTVGADVLLTPREQDVVELIAQGLSNKEIAGTLGMSPKTVMHHTSAIYRKLGVRGRAEATAWAVRQGLSGEGAAG